MVALMQRPKWPGLLRENTRHSKTVWYVRVDHGPRIRLKSDYEDKAAFRAEYEEVYAALLKGQKPGKPHAKSSGPAAKTLAWLWDQYTDSIKWSELAPATRKQRMNIMKHVLKGGGDMPIDKINRKIVTIGRDARAKTPAQANNFLKTLRQLFAWAIKADHMTENPVEGVDMLDEDTGEGFPAWTEEEIAKFEAYWPIGTRERLAFAVLLYTGLRRGDAATLGKQHFGKDGVIVIKPAKTIKSSGITVHVPVHPEFATAIKACPPKGLFIIETVEGKPRVKEGFGNWFGDIARKAGVEKNCHGLRKSAAMRVAEAGSTEAQMMALFGWTDPGMAHHYIKAANAKKLALQAAAKVGATGNVGDLFSIGG